MGECNLDQIEYADLYGVLSQEIPNEIYSRRKIIAGKVETPWRCEIPCTGENGNNFSSSSVRNGAACK